jgi:hypothetical protein
MYGIVKKSVTCAMMAFSDKLLDRIIEGNISNKQPFVSYFWVGTGIVHLVNDWLLAERPG